MINIHKVLNNHSDQSDRGYVVFDQSEAWADVSVLTAGPRREDDSRPRGGTDSVNEAYTFVFYYKYVKVENANV